MSGAEERAREVLADTTEAMAVAGAYVARDIRSGNLSPDNKRAIAAMLAYGNERAAQEREACAAIAGDRALGRYRLYQENHAGINVYKAVEAEEIAAAILSRGQP